MKSSLFIAPPSRSTAGFGAGRPTPCPAAAQQPHPVQYDQKRDAGVGEDGEPHVRAPEHRRDQHDELGRHRERHVRAHDAHRAPPEREEARQRRQVVAEQRDVGGLERRVGAGGAHRDADVGGRERGRVVDAVADHRDRADSAP